MEGMSNIRKLLKEDFQITCKEMAKFLLGKLLVRKINNKVILKARIVETECYLGGVDKASHSFGGRKTPGNEPMYMEPGTAYVYMTYGMYYCFNISSLEPGAAVLLRSLHPLSGIEHMRKFRKGARKKSAVLLKDTNLCNGPSKLCMSMDIRKDNCNKLDLTDNDLMWIEDDPDFDGPTNVISTSRIGIASAGEEWASKPLRFYILGCPHVSKRDKNAEKEFSEDSVD